MSKFFIEIGTSDFDTLIPLAKGGWKGIFVEPVEYLLDNLERIDGCEYVNAAITAHNGKTTINYQSYPEEEGHKGIGYVTDKNIIGDFIPHSHEPAKPSNYFWRNNFENVTKKAVDCMTLDKLIEKYDVKKIDFLKIDVEGMEHTILHSYSWKIKPKIMNPKLPLEAPTTPITLSKLIVISAKSTLYIPLVNDGSKDFFVGDLVCF